MDKVFGEYFNIIQGLLSHILETQYKEIEEAAKAVSRTIIDDGMVYVYGSGHAHMSAEELFYRAGGIANVYPIFIEPLMLHESAPVSSLLEKEEGYVKGIVDALPISNHDVIIVTSTSGRNAAPIEAAIAGRGKGAVVITIFSREYSLISPSGHSSGKRLMDIGHVKIDNGAPVGDAALVLDGMEAKVAPVSSVVNFVILQSIIAQAVQDCLEEGFTDIPVFKSGNLPGGKEFNETMIEKYSRRVPPLQNKDF